MRESLGDLRSDLVGFAVDLAKSGIDRTQRVRSLATQAGVSAVEFRELFDNLTVRGRMSEAAAADAIKRGAQMTGGDATAGVQRLRDIAQSMPAFAAASMGLGELRATGDVDLTGGLFGATPISEDQIKAAVAAAAAIESVKVGVGNATVNRAAATLRGTLQDAAAGLGVPVPVAIDPTDDLGGW